MRRPVNLLCITPKTGVVHKYVDRKRQDTASTQGCPTDEIHSALEYFRLHGLPNEDGAQTS